MAASMKENVHPCCYPVIPLWISAFVHQEGRYKNVYCSLVLNVPKLGTALFLSRVE